jgi:pyruvate formate lyase activating enzyme
MKTREAPMTADPVTGLVLNIQHFCTDDGPGIRTNVFLKFCSLHCKWCSNPESIGQKPELAYDARKCIGAKACGRCLNAPAPAGAFYVVEGEDTVRVNWDLAHDCGEETTSLCPSGALSLFGHRMTVDDVLAEVEQDEAFYRESSGGITLSGGECLLQPDFSAALLAEARSRGFNKAIETAGNVPWAFMAKVLPFVDVMLHDHKLTNPAKHKMWTGADNSRILANFKQAYETFPNTVFIARTPLIPGVNDDEEHIRAVLAFIRPHRNVVDYQLLPYHRFGAAKYGFLGKVYDLKDFAPPPQETLDRLNAIIAEAFGRTVPARAVPGAS